MKQRGLIVIKMINDSKLDEVDLKLFAEQQKEHALKRFKDYKKIYYGSKKLNDVRNRERCFESQLNL